MPDPSGPTFCISDLHLHDRFTNGALFTKDKEDIFSGLVDDIFEEQDELVLAGDIHSIYVSQIPAVRPEDQIVDGLQRLPQFANQGVLQELLGAFARLLYENDFPAPAILDFPGLANLVVTPDRLKAALSDDTSVDATLESQAALAIGGKPSGLSLTDGTPSLVVMGHTHDLDLTRPNYINLGTWIDHVPALGAAPDLTLPLLRIDAGPQAVLYDARDYVHGKRDRPLWRSQPPAVRQ